MGLFSSSRSVTLIAQPGGVAQGFGDVLRLLVAVAAVKRDCGVVVRMSERDVMLLLVDDLVPPHERRNEPEGDECPQDEPFVAARIGRNPRDNGVILEQ